MPRSQITPSEGGDAYQFISLSGNVQSMTQVVTDVTRAGVDGQAYRLEGRRGRPFELVGMVDCIDADDARLFYSNMVDLVGTVVSLYDDHGNEGTDVVVLDVENRGMQPIGGAVGGTLWGTASVATYLLTVRFLMAVSHPPEAP